MSNITLDTLAESIENLAGIMVRGFESVDKRFDRIEERLDRVEQRLDSLESEMIEVRREIRSLRMDMERLQEESKSHKGFAKEIDELGARLNVLELNVAQVK